MHFRTIADLNDRLIAGLPKLPRDIDLVVGIPRSGMLPATLLGLYLNIAITDVDGLLGNRIWNVGKARDKSHCIRQARDARKILVIDDSSNSGNQLKATRDRILKGNLAADLLYGAVYATQQSCHQLDFYFDICPIPRMFEWNLMHHPGLENACMDIDGVLCRDPSHDQNDDGSNYAKFLANVEPLWVPTVPIGWLVTSRLEKYRSQTENWLARHGVKYDELVMLNMNSAAERRKACCHGQFKGAVYRSKPAELFIESDSAQASEIAQLACKAVFCTADRQVYLPSTLAVAAYLTRNLPPRAPHLAWHFISALRRRIAL